jgi:hypothetical protein
MAKMSQLRGLRSIGGLLRKLMLSIVISKEAFEFDEERKRMSCFESLSGRQSMAILELIFIVWRVKA